MAVKREILLKALLVSTVLLPWIGLGAGLPGLRVEWFFVILLLLTGRLASGVFGSMPVVAGGTLSVFMLASIIVGDLTLGNNLIARDLFSLFQPVLYVATFVAVGSLRLTTRQLGSVIAVLVGTIAIAAALAVVQYWKPGLVSGVLSGYTDPSKLSQFAGGSRATATMANPNDLGFLMAFGVALTVFTPQLIGGNLALLRIPILAGALASGSRTAMVCIIWIGVVYFCGLGWGKKLRFVLGLTLLIGLGGYLLPSAGAVVGRSVVRYQVLVVGVSGASSWQPRVRNAAKTLSISLESPVFGHGPHKGGFADGANIDNEYVLTIYRYGLLGLLATLALFIGLWVQLFRLRNHPDPRLHSFGRLSVAVFGASAIFAYTAGIFMSFRLMMLLVVLSAMAFGLVRSEARSSPSVRGKPV